jgi:radical SAM protein with 4Fe4S-binding SPASM domain
LDHICGRIEKYPVCKWCHNLHHPPVPDGELISYLKNRGLDGEIKPFINRMKSAGKLRKGKNYTLIKPMDFKGLKQTLIVELSAACNLKCVMCEQSFDRTRKNKGLMKFETFKKIVDELVSERARANVVNIFWSGESLYHPEFEKMIRYAADINKDYIGWGSFDLHTNGNLLSKRISDEIVRGRQFARILISLDAATSKTYDKIRRGGDFSKVVENVKYLVNKRNSKKADWPGVTLQFVLSETNADEVEQFIKLASDIFGGRKKFQINYDWDKPQPFKGDVVFIKRIDELTNEKQVKSEKLHKEICIRLGLIEKKEIDSRIVESDEYRVDENGINPLTGKKAIRKPCAGLFTHMAIRWDGVVSACCRDIKCALNIGNINNSTIMELFNSDSINRLRLKHIEGKADEIPACADCPNQLTPVITDEEVIYYLKSVGRSDMIVPYLKRVGVYEQNNSNM